jgi:hypothetical protein
VITPVKDSYRSDFSADSKFSVVKADHFLAKDSLTVVSIVVGNPGMPPNFSLIASEATAKGYFDCDFLCKLNRVLSVPDNSNLE